MTSILIAGALLHLLLTALLVFGVLHYIDKVKPMSLLQDAEAVFIAIEHKVEAAVEAALKPILDELAALKSENGSLLARLEQFGETVVSKITAAVEPHVESAPVEGEQPAG